MCQQQKTHLDADSRAVLGTPHYSGTSKRVSVINPEGARQREIVNDVAIA